MFSWTDCYMLARACKCFSNRTMMVKVPDCLLFVVVVFFAFFFLDGRLLIIWTLYGCPYSCQLKHKKRSLDVHIRLFSKSFEYFSPVKCTLFYLDLFCIFSSNSLSPRESFLNVRFGHRSVPFNSNSDPNVWRDFTGIAFTVWWQWQIGNLKLLLRLISDIQTINGVKHTIAIFSCTSIEKDKE